MTAPSNKVYLQGTTTPVSADQFNTFLQGVSSVAAMRSFTGTIGMTLYLQGTTGAGTGHSAVYYWNATSTAADDGSTVIAPTGSTVGRWIVLPLTDAGFLPETGGTMSGAITFAPPNMTTYPPASTGSMIEQDQTYVLPNTATGGIYFGNALNFVITGNPQGTQVWQNLDRGFLETDNTANIDVVVRYIQGVRPGGFSAPNTVVQALVVQAIDQTSAASSVAGGLSTLEVDLQANGLDDTVLANRGRAAITIGADNATGGAAAEFSYALGVFSNAAKGFHQTLQLTNPFRDAGIDFRNSPAWSGSGTGTDNAVWLRTGQKLALDTAGAAGAAVVTLESVNGLFGQILMVPLSGIQFGGTTSVIISPDAASTVLACSLPWRLPGYLVSALPVVAGGNLGAMAFARNARNTGEGAGSGTGCVVVVNNAAAWVCVWSGVAPTV